MTSPEIPGSQGPAERTGWRAWHDRSERAAAVGAKHGADLRTMDKPGEVRVITWGGS